MSNYTTELRKIVESGYDLGLDEYEIFDESYREKLNERIIKYFYFREIGFGTVQKFIYKLNQKMDLIMPKYNELYKSELLKADPLLTFNVETDTNEQRDMDLNSTENRDKQKSVDETRDQNGRLSNTSVSESNNNSIVNDRSVESANQTDNVNAKSKMVGSETPNEDISNFDVDDFTYADNVEVKEDDNIKTQNTETESENIQEEISNGVVNNQSEGTTSNNEQVNSQIDDTETIDSTESKTENVINTVTRKGVEMNIIELVNRYHKVFKTVDKMIIDELKDLFMLVY